MRQRPYSRSSERLRPKSGSPESWPCATMPRRMGAGAGEEVEQPLPVAIAHHALQRGEVLVEAAEHFEHGVAVVEEHVAPHRRVGGGDAGEVAKAAGGELHHLGLRHRLEVGRGAHDVVGDEVRHVARDRQHDVVVGRAHRLDVGAGRLPEGGEAGERLRLGAGWRRQDHPAFREQRGEAGVGAGIFGAGDRVAGDEMRMLRQQRRDVGEDRHLGRADV